MKAERIKPKWLGDREPAAPIQVNQSLSRMKTWKRLHDIIGFTPPLDGIVSAACGFPCIDLFKLEQRIPNYDAEKCTYKGKPNFSMRKAIIREWGKEAEELIKQMI
jgi:hypothetical protein